MRSSGAILIRLPSLWGADVANDPAEDGGFCWFMLDLNLWACYTPKDFGNRECCCLIGFRSDCL